MKNHTDEPDSSGSSKTNAVLGAIAVGGIGGALLTMAAVTMVLMELWEPGMQSGWHGIRKIVYASGVAGGAAGAVWLCWETTDETEQPDNDGA